MKKLIFILPLLIMATSCRHKDDGVVVARAYDNYLYATDIEGLVGAGVSAEDSAAIVSGYINQWVQQMVVLEKAKKNIKNNFDKELQNYKNSLLTYEYERLVIEQLLDTNVTTQQVQDYYNEHKELFVLKSSIVRAIYVKVAKDSPSVAKLRKLFAKIPFGDKELNELSRLANGDAVECHLDADSWMNFYDLQSKVPIESYNEMVFLRSTKNYFTSDENFAYFVRIMEYKVTDEPSPIELEYDNIRTMLLNRRKIELIKNMQRDLIRKAEQSKEIEIM